MLFFRVIGVLAAATIAVLVLLYVVTSDRRYLRFAWRASKYSIALLGLILVLFFVERMIVML